jgi:hypothetical protein
MFLYPVMVQKYGIGNYPSIFEPNPKKTFYRHKPARPRPAEFTRHLPAKSQPPSCRE